MRVGIVGLVLFCVAAQLAFAGTLDSVRSDKVLKVAYRTDVPPFSSAGSAAPTGFSIDLCRMIADRLAKQLG
ncbi:MAG TPA: amino acid ABC transporter substrate-binding protein, partial [Pseudomonadales bacterium]